MPGINFASTPLATRSTTASELSLRLISLPFLSVLRLEVTYVSNIIIDIASYLNSEAGKIATRNL